MGNRIIFLILISLLSPQTLWAEDLDLSAIKELEQKLPKFKQSEIDQTEQNFRAQNRRYQPSRKIVTFEEIKKSPLLEGSLNSGVPVVELETNTAYNLPRAIYVKYHRLPDEFGNLYLVTNDFKVTHKVSSDYLSPVEIDLAMNPKPRYFSEAPVLKLREVDTLLKLDHEVFAQLGFNQGSYFKDLSGRAMSSGDTILAGYQFITNWKLSLKLGAHLKYEKSSFLAKDGTTMTYTSPTIGVTLRTRNFNLEEIPVRFQTMFGLSPFSRLVVLASDKSSEFKFNSFDINNSLQFPLENFWGEWSLGIFHQAQWLNIKSQSDEASLKATNRINTSFGLSLSQVFL